MLPELGQKPTPEEIAERLAMPLEKLRKVLEVAKRPIHLETATGKEHPADPAAERSGWGRA